MTKVLFPEFRDRLYKLGRPSGGELEWTYNVALSPEENSLCAKVWCGYKSPCSLVRRADRLAFEKIYKRIFPEAL